jgi:hypothetical protein
MSEILIRSAYWTRFEKVMFISGFTSARDSDATTKKRRK